MYLILVCLLVAHELRLATGLFSRLISKTKSVWITSHVLVIIHPRHAPIQTLLGDLCLLHTHFNRNASLKYRPVPPMLTLVLPETFKCLIHLIPHTMLNNTILIPLLQLLWPFQLSQNNAMTTAELTSASATAFVFWLQKNHDTRGSVIQTWINTIYSRQLITHRTIYQDWTCC